MKQIIPTVLVRSGWHNMIALGIAAVLTLLVVLQLFWFEDMAGEMSVVLPSAWSQLSMVIASVFVVSEVLAVAYFIPVALSGLARWCVRVLAVVVPIAWMLVLSSALLISQAANVVYLGAKLDIALGWSHVGLMAILLGAVLTVIVKDSRES